MTNPNEPDATPDSFIDLPLQPTGSGVADLEIAFEQMKLTEENGEPDIRADDGVESAGVDFSDDAAESEGHPS